MICVLCPKGCRITVADGKISGYSCSKGEGYAKKELENPQRSASATVAIEGTFHPRLPVKSDKALPKALVTEAVRSLANVTVSAPVKIGDVIVHDVLGSGVNFVATRTMEKS